MKIAEAFAKAAAENRAAFIAYLPAGYPTIEQSYDLVAALVEGGADIVEVGMPYSDPVMDGPVIQRAVEESLRAGTTMSDAIAIAGVASQAGAAGCVMSYWNPIEQYGIARFCNDFASAGGAGVITPDLSPAEAELWNEQTLQTGIERVFLVAPSSTDARLATVTGVCTGFVYAASTMGITGNTIEVGDTARALVARTREHTALPVAVGLGVSTAAQVAAIAQYADGVIVGSAFIRSIEACNSHTERVAAVRNLARELSAGTQR
jgi:tryptophan synthase alpha chain